MDTPTSSRLDQQRFSQLVLDTRHSLYGYLRRQGASPDVAEDLVQESLVRAYRALPTLRDWNKARGWLFGIARHVFLDETRRAAVRERLTAGPSEAPIPLDEQAELAGQARLIRRAIAELKPPRPEVIDLYYGAGLTVEEIANALGIPAGTVKTHLFRARAELRGRLRAGQED